VANNRGTSAGGYLVEYDGVTVCRASEVSGLGLKHTPFKIAVGDRANAIIGRSNYEANEITVKHASAMNNTGNEVFRDFRNWLVGRDVTKRTFRVIQLDENGSDIAMIWEASECVPTEFTKESNKGDSNDADYFTFKIQPTDLEMLEF
jgi:hypothetical protein